MECQKPAACGKTRSQKTGYCARQTGKMMPQAETFPCAQGKARQQPPYMACIIDMHAFRTQQGQQSPACKERNGRVAAPGAGLSAKQPENGEKGCGKAQGYIGRRAKEHGQRIAQRSAQQGHQAGASRSQRAGGDRKGRGGKHDIAVEMRRIAMEEKSRQAAIAFVIDIKAGAVQTPQTLLEIGRGQGRGDRQKTCTTGMHEEQRKYGQCGPLPALADRGEGRLSPLPGNALFFLLVKMMLEQGNVTGQRRDKAMRGAVRLPEAKGQTPGGKKKNPFLLFAIGGKTLQPGEAYPERGKKARTQSQAITSDAGSGAAPGGKARRRRSWTHGIKKAPAEKAAGLLSDP